ncbi:NAD(P)-dependent oxidoreductase [Microbacterium sp. Mu-80]|uniref:NAD(P)-dependent oxidoreductase n=1 Tax=Microbacterium bandirmense TaxID=3122050 RepID=A0ABU8LI54_9MICO
MSAFAGLRQRVVLLEPIHADGVDILRADADTILLSGAGDAEALAAADAVIVRSRPYGEAEMDKSPGLRVIGRHGVGVDNIDLDAAERRGIAIVNTPRSNTESVAEYAIAIVMMCVKRLVDGQALLTSGGMPPGEGSLPAQVVRHGLVGREISGMRLGLAGYGAIGRAVARRALALGMIVTAYDPFVPGEAIREGGVVPVESLDELLFGSEVVSLHLPGDPSGAALFGARELSLLPDGALLVNAARGSLIDADALVAEVASGRIRAAIDVYDPEPPSVDSGLFRTPGILTTPHQAAMTEEALRAMAVDVARAVLNALLVR